MVGRTSCVERDYIVKALVLHPTIPLFYYIRFFIQLSEFAWTLNENSGSLASISSKNSSVFLTSASALSLLICKLNLPGNPSAHPLSSSCMLGRHLLTFVYHVEDLSPATLRRRRGAMGVRTESHTPSGSQDFYSIPWSIYEALPAPSVHDFL